LGAEVEVLHGEPDGSRINVQCGCTHPADLILRIQKGPPVDAGFAFDGDADRCLAVDETGQLVDGDQILLAFAEFLSARGQLPHNTVVATVMSNLGLEVALRDRGLTLRRAAVGDRFVLQDMVQSGAVLGGEQSGHIIQLDYGPGGDGLCTAARLLQVVGQSGHPMSRVTGAMQHFPQLLVNVRARNKAGLQHEEIRAAIEQVETQLANRGRLLVRPSGTEPLVRVMAEGPDAAELHTLVHGLARLIEQRLGDAT
jgi:phosphoglucosamine mutase